MSVYRVVAKSRYCLHVYGHVVMPVFVLAFCVCHLVVSFYGWFWNAFASIVFVLAVSAFWALFARYDNKTDKLVTIPHRDGSWKDFTARERKNAVFLLLFYGYIARINEKGGHGFSILSYVIVLLWVWLASRRQHTRNLILGNAYIQARKRRQNQA